MTNSLIHCTRILRRVEVFHTYSDLKFWYLIYFNYSCCLYNADKLDSFLIYFLRLQHAVVVFLAAFFLFCLCELNNSLDKVFNISLQSFLIWFYFFTFWSRFFIMLFALFHKTTLRYFKIELILSETAGIYCFSSSSHILSFLMKKKNLHNFCNISTSFRFSHDACD